MNWLQKRLNELKYTHSDLQKALTQEGIERVRATITGWTNDKPVSLLSNPEHTSKLAKVLNWTVMDLLVAAGYDLETPAELIPIIMAYQQADEQQRRDILMGLEFIVSYHDKEDSPSP